MNSAVAALVKICFSQSKPNPVLKNAHKERSKLQGSALPVLHNAQIVKLMI